MREYRVDPTVREVWKSFPLRIEGERRSKCCGQPTLLVQSMDGGFVTQNCARCGGLASLGSDEFERLNLWVACPECKQRMQAAILTDKNYGYVCTDCELELRLADLLPQWSEIC